MVRPHGRPRKEKGLGHRLVPGGAGGGDRSSAPAPAPPVLCVDWYYGTIEYGIAGRPFFFDLHAARSVLE